MALAEFWKNAFHLHIYSSICEPESLSATRYCLCSMLEQIFCVCFWDTKSRFCGAGKGDWGRPQSLPRKKAVGIALLPVVIDVLLIIAYNRSSALHVTMTDTAAGYNHGRTSERADGMQRSLHQTLRCKTFKAHKAKVFQPKNFQNADSEIPLHQSRLKLSLLEKPSVGLKLHLRFSRPETVVVIAVFVVTSLLPSQSSFLLLLVVVYCTVFLWCVLSVLLFSSVLSF